MLPRHESLSLAIQLGVCAAFLAVSPPLAVIGALAVLARLLWITRGH